MALLLPTQSGVKPYEPHFAGLGPTHGTRHGRHSAASEAQEDSSHPIPFNPFASKGIDHPRPFIPKIQVGRRPATFAHSCVLHVPHETISCRSLADAT